MRHHTSRSFASGGGTSVAVLALVIAAAAAPAAARSHIPAAGSHVTTKKATINTYKSWDGATAMSGVNCTGASNEGQVIKVPKSKSSLDKYVLWMADSFSGSL